VNEKAAEPALALRLTAPNPQLAVGSPIIVEVVETNTSAHDISVWRENRQDAGGHIYGVEVTNQQGTLPPETELGHYLNGHADKSQFDPYKISRYGSGGGACMTLKPGASFTDKLNAARLYDLAVEGKYEIVVEAIDPLTYSRVKSNPVTVMITQ
jgi:hypothetical protein